MSESKRCPGYADRPAHTVPIVGFNSSGETLDYYCVECRKSSRKYSTSNTIVALVEKYIPRKIRRTHPQRIKMNAFAREVYLSNRTEQELKEFIEEIEDGAWLGTIFPRLPKDNLPRSKPARKRVGTTYDRLLPKEGWVYIMDTYRYNKIGKTWEDGLRARRSEARRWGPADLVYWAWFDDAMAAEKEIHRRLKRYRVEKENVGEELFNCPVSIARDEIKKLQKELEDDTRKEQKVG